MDISTIYQTSVYLPVILDKGTPLHHTSVEGCISASATEQPYRLFAVKTDIEGATAS